VDPHDPLYAVPRRRRDNVIISAVSRDSQVEVEVTGLAQDSEHKCQLVGRVLVGVFHAKLKHGCQHFVGLEQLVELLDGGNVGKAEMLGVHTKRNGVETAQQVRRGRRD